MKIAIVYNRDSQAVINLFGVSNREKYGMETINRIKKALESGGHQVKTFEGDKNIFHNLEEFMPAVISGERPGLVFNLSYGIQGRARYTHIPSILEMLGVPYVGSSPETHGIALDKVVTKMILQQYGLPTPKYTVLDEPNSAITEDLQYPLIVKPKDESTSFGLRIVRNEAELREGVRVIYGEFRSQTLVEEYIEGREVNVALLGNDPVEALPPVELVFPTGEKIYTFEDKASTSGRTVEKLCPAPLTDEQTKKVQSLAIAAFKALGCFDSARVDFRIDANGNFYILEINSMASMGPDGSFVYAAQKVGLDYDVLANRLIEIASKRYFGSVLPEGLYGEGVASSRAGIVCMLQALTALYEVNKLDQAKVGVFIYSDAGRGMRYSSRVLRQAAAVAGNVIVLQPGFLGGQVVDQRRGSRKFSIQVDGSSMRIGFRGEQEDVLSWFLKKAASVSDLSRPEHRLSAAVQEVHSERYSMLLPHRVRATVYITYLESQLADLAEAEIRKVFTPAYPELRAYVEKLEDRPPLVRSDVTASIILRLKKISEEWKLPFGVESSLLPSAAGEVPENVPVICGFSPAGREIFTPYECVHRGELLQRALLLTLFLLEVQ